MPVQVDVNNWAVKDDEGQAADALADVIYDQLDEGQLPAYFPINPGDDVLVVEKKLNPLTPAVDVLKRFPKYT